MKEALLLLKYNERGGGDVEERREGRVGRGTLASYWIKEKGTVDPFSKRGPWIRFHKKAPWILEQGMDDSLQHRAMLLNTIIST